MSKNFPDKISRQWCLDNIEKDGDKKEEYDPTFKMPFGKFQGKPMKEVPTYYLHYLWRNGKEKDKRCPVARYIRDNLVELKKQYKTELW